jgi:hypothetical protein
MKRHPITQCRRKNGERCRLATKKNETIGGGDMSKATDYTPEEWKAISSAPMMAGLLVSLSDMSGPIGLAKEAMAVVKAVNDTASGTTAELIKSVADEIRSQGGRSDLSEIRSDPANARAALIDRCKQAVALVEQKSPPRRKTISDGCFRWRIPPQRRLRREASLVSAAPLLAKPRPLPCVIWHWPWG